MAPRPVSENVWHDPWRARRGSDLRANMFPRRQVVISFSLLAIAGISGCTGTKASKEQGSQENPTVWSLQRGRWAFGGSALQLPVGRGLIYIIDLQNGQSESTLRATQQRLAERTYSSITITQITSDGIKVSAAEAAEALIRLMRRDKGTDAPVGVVGLGHGGRDCWPAIAERSVAIPAAVMINCPFVHNVAFQSHRTLNLLTLYVQRDEVVMATYDRAHHALISNDIHHDMITYGDVDPDFYDESSGQYSRSTWDDALNRAIGWFDQYAHV